MKLKKAMRLNYVLIIFICLFIFGISLFYIQNNNKSNKKDLDKLSVMIGEGSVIQAIKVSGEYISDDFGNLMSKNVCEISDKNEITNIISEFNKYKIQFIDTSKINTVKVLSSKGMLKYLHINLIIKNPKYDNITASITCDISKEIFSVEIQRSLKNKSDKAIYGGYIYNKELYTYISNRLLIN